MRTKDGLAFLFWLLGVVVSTGVVALGVVAHGSTVLGAVLAVVLLAVLPLLLARRAPRVGGWIAFSMLAGAPLAFEFALCVGNPTYVGAPLRCGTGAAVAIVSTPVIHGVLMLPVLALWGMRRQFASWLRWPARVAVLVVGVMLLLALVRSASAPAVTDVRAAELMGPPIGVVDAQSPVLEVDGLTLRHRCEPGACRVEATRGEGAVSVLESFEPQRPLRVAVHHRGPFVAFSQARPDSTARDWLGVLHREKLRLGRLRASSADLTLAPAQEILLIAALGLVAVAVSMMVRPITPLVWRRLGAKRAEQEALQDDVIALHLAHFAVAVTIAIPLLAAAALGLVV